MSERMNETTRANLADLVARLARLRRDDPSIAGVLGITAAQVRRIRKEYEIEAGEQRWTGPR